MYVLQNNNQQQREIESKSNHTLLTDPKYEEENINLQKQNKHTLQCERLSSRRR